MGEFRMPSLGADMADGTLRKWRVKKGDLVKRGDIIAEVETQKGIIDIEVFESGQIGELLIKEDEKVPVGTLLTHIEKIEMVPEQISILIPAMEAKKEFLKASPLARKIAEEQHLNLSQIIGTGPEGAITKTDVEHYLMKEKAPAALEQTGSGLSEMRKAIASAMEKSQHEIPPYTVRTVIDFYPVKNFLQSINEKRSLEKRILSIALFGKAVALAAQSYPTLNGWWREKFIGSSEVHLGLVIALRTGGVVVPCLQHADQMNLDQMMESLSELIKRSRAGHLKSSDLETPSITLSNLGEMGVESMTGIIYPPQVGLVAIGGVKNRPWAIDDMLTIRPTIEISLSADHRASDGVYGSQFLQKISELLSKPEQL